MATKTKTRRKPRKKKPTIRDRELDLYRRLEALAPKLKLGDKATAQMMVAVATFAEELRAKGQTFDLAYVEQQVAEAERTGAWLAGGMLL